MLNKRLLTLTLSLLIIPTLVSAEMIFQDGGWNITMPSWTTSASGAAVVRDTSPAIPNDVMVLEIFKVFKGGPDMFGTMPSIVMTFEQMADDPQTINKIVITDETVHNFTTRDWYDFHFTLISPESAAVFNKAQSFPGEV